jgi:glutamate synthase (NADPH/NADH) small chain
VLKQTEVVEVEWNKDENGRWQMTEKPETTRIIDTDLVFLALGFVHPVHDGLVKEFGLDLDDRGNVKVGENFQTSVDKVFAAGDAASGASLVVRAIDQGRVAAESIHYFLLEEK